MEIVKRSKRLVTKDIASGIYITAASLMLTGYLEGSR